MPPRQADPRVVAATCGHGLCALIGGGCSIVIVRTRGCRRNVNAHETSPEVLDEVRTLIARIGADRDREAAVRLAQIVRREALDDRNLLAIARGDELDFADALAALVRA
jgi:hypothetical protein